MQIVFLFGFLGFCREDLCAYPWFGRIFIRPYVTVAIVQSDFVNHKTGDTLSFVQLNNRPYTKVFDVSAFKKLDNIENGKLGTVQVLEMTSPYHINMIAWKGKYQEFVMTATKLSVIELIGIADSSKRLGT